MISQKEKELLVRGILTNSVNNNIYSWKTEPEPEIVDLFLKFAKEDPAFLVKALLIYEKHGVIENLKYCALAALASSDDKELFKRGFRKTITTLGDIYNFSILLDSNDSDNYGFRLDSIAKDLLRKKLEKITELDLLPYFVLKRNREKIEFSNLIKLLNPAFKNPHIEKAISIIFGKKPKRHVLKSQLPMMSALNQIQNQKSPAKLKRIIMKYNLPSKSVLPLAYIKNPKILYQLLNNISPEDIIDLFDTFFRKGCFDRTNAFVLHQAYFQPRLAMREKYFKKHRVLAIMEKIIIGLSDTKRLDYPYKVFMSLLKRPDSQLNIWYLISQMMYIYSFKIGMFKIFAQKDVVIFIDGSSSMFRKVESIIPNRNFNFPFPKLAESVFVIDIALWYAEWFELRFPKRKQLSLRYLDREDTYNYKNKFEMKLKNGVLTMKSPYSRQLSLSAYDDALAPFRYLLKAQIKYDIILIFTDYEFSTESIDLWKAYRNDINPESCLFLAQICPFYHEPLSLPEGYFRICGWGENTINFIVNTLNRHNFLKEL